MFLSLANLEDEIYFKGGRFVTSPYFVSSENLVMGESKFGANNNFSLFHVVIVFLFRCSLDRIINPTSAQYDGSSFMIRLQEGHLDSLVINN